MLKNKSMFHAALILLGVLFLVGIIIYIGKIRSEKLYAKDFPQLGVEYISHSIINDKWKQYKISGQDIENFKENTSKSLRKKLYKSIDSGEMAPIYIKYINKNVGYGVFAERPIRKGEVIGPYTGNVISMDEYFNLTGNKGHDYTWKVGSIHHIKTNEKATMCVDSYKCGNETRFVNHSSDPNAEIYCVPYKGIWHGVYVASKPIAQDQQILISYGNSYWEGRDYKYQELAHLKTAFQAEA